MPTLNEYLGGLIASVTNARVMADAQTVAVAEQYARHDLLKHFAVPRMRIGDIELTIPVAIEGLVDRVEYQLAPIGNDRFRTEIYREVCASIGATELPLLASNDLVAALSEETPALIQLLREDPSDKSFFAFSDRTAQRFAEIAERHDLFKVMPGIEFSRERMIERLTKRCGTLVTGVEQKTSLDQLEVVAESHRLREQRAEDIVRIRLKIGEDGMEWQTIEKSDGTIERRLLPE
ncbi:hypothetical protein [Lysobacter brunescens]|uniref:Uncharacterized protein n=1 Tax=Lysobacter brunescens TaxID=262323 RepID=A0ABW2YAS8_9GAMM